MKILLFMDNPSIQTGYASTCRLTAKELTARGHQVYAMGFNSGPVGDSIVDWYDLKIVPNYAIARDGNAIYGDYECLKRAFEEVQPDVMLFHNDSYRYSYLKQMTPEMQERSVFWLPFEGDYPDKLGNEIFSKIAATRFVTQHALNVNAPELKGKDLGVIYHAIEMGEANRPYPKDEAKRRHVQPRIDQMGIKKDAAKLFVVSRVDRHQPRKYWDLTIEAFAKFAKGKDDVVLLAKCNPRDCTMWDDPKKEGIDLEAMAKKLGVDVCFDDFFFNPQSLHQSFYWPADVFITTTSGEGFGLCAAEAMSNGVPVIAPNVPVLPEVVGDGGMFCKIKEKVWYDKMSVFHNVVDVDDVAAKLEVAYQDWKAGGPYLADLGAKARALAESRYDPKVVYDKWDQVFKDVKERGELSTIITVIYNVTGKDQLFGDDGIDKLRQTMEDNVKYPYEWIIVDNGSPAREETREWLEKAAKNNPRIKPLLLDDNYGFAGANNRAIALAKGKTVVLVNPDSEAIPPVKHGLVKDWLQIYVERANSDDSIGVIGMKLNKRDDILPGAVFPYFACVLLSRKCLDAIKLPDGKWFDEAFWPAYYEDLDFCWRAAGKGFKVVDNDTPFWHKSGGTNKYAIEGGPGGKVVPHLKASLDRMSVSNAGMADWSRKKLELEKDGMQGLIDGNIKYLQSKWGESARKKIRVVWQTHIGEAVGFSELAEGLIPELHRLGFDVYVNDWSNGAKITNPIIKELWEKTRRAKEQGDDLYDSINIVCWLMETFLGVEAGYKVGISLCESTKVRESYLQACNSMDRILTFSEFCKRVQLDSGFKSPIHVIPPGVDPIYVNLAKRPLKKDKYTFLAVGVSQDRKDTRRLVSAFCEAFPKDSPFVPEVPSCPIKPNQVELVVKSNNFGELEWISKPGPNGEPPFDQRANIRAIFTGWDQRAKQPDFSKKEMYDLYASADALVHPSHGEGIGYPICEAAATGLPVIFTNWSSPAEYFNEENSYPCSLSPYPGTTFTQAYPGAPGDNGQWSNCHIGHLKFLMYHVLQNLEEAFKKGEKAHEHVKDKYNWKNSAAALAPLLFEWDADRRNKDARNEFDPLTFVKPRLEPVTPEDRIMIDVVTRDRRPYLSVLICSLLHQTFKNWDMIIEIDDADENVLHDHLVMSLLARARLEGHEWRMIRSHRQGPHMAHDRTLFMTHENPERKYKLICRIDDDIYVEPTYLEKLFEPFVADKDCEIAAVGGVYPDPKRPKDPRGTDKGQMAPPGFEKDINYGGKIDHNVPWPYVCYYPEGTKPRLVEHLYSSFLFRVELGVAIGGYCKLFSAIGHREESDFSYRFYLAGYKLFIHPEAIGYHFQAPAGGIRSGDIGENKNELASGDHKIYERRLAKWKKRAAMRVVAAPKPPVPHETEQVKNANEEPKKPTPRMIAVINGGPDVTVLQDAVTRTAEFADEIYVTTPNPLCRAKLKNEKLRMISCSTEETTALSLALAKTTDFVMTIKDTHRFLGNPRALLVDWIDDYAFEVYQTYDKDGRTFIGPELRNECLVSRRNKNDGQKPVDVSKVKYTDIMVLDEAKLDGLSGKSLNGLVLIPLDKTDKMSWTKVCVYQFPEGELKPPRAATYEPEIKDIVSIIIPTNNRLGMLRKCIDSIYSHTSTPFEIVVVDNGSTDGTREYLEKESVKRPAVRYTRNATNLGYQKAANMGVSLSRGKHVLLFNDDAWVDGDEPDGRDWLSTYVDELEGDPKLGLVGPHAPNGGLSPTLKKPMLFFWCVMTRREIWDEVGQLDDVMFYNYGGDDDWCERLRQKGYSIKVKKANLRHLMSLVPETIKNKELEESRAKLLAKYKI
jgi:GT2 family glycosyltransferase/glycosyltransferase involved in cell wall biosynthesis